MKLSTLLIFIWSVLSCFSAYSQPFTNPYEERCKYLDKTELSTNHLINYTWPLAYMSLLKGSEKDSIDATIFEQLYYDLKMTEVGNGDLPDFKIYEESVRSYNKLYTIPIGLIYQKFNYLKDELIENEWLLLEDNHYVRAPDYNGSLYDEATTFAMAPLISGSHFTSGKPITFIFPGEFIFNGTDQTIHQYQIDFGNGNGFQTIQPGSQLEVLYNSAGNKTLILRAITDTDTLRTTSPVLLTEVHPTNTTSGLLSATGRDGICYPDRTLVFGGANAYIRYADPDNPQITKPLIFVEGLDLGKANEASDPMTNITIRHGDFGWDVLTTGIGPDPSDKKKLIDLEVYRNLPGLIDDFTEQEYDVILLDFTDGADFIQDNAQVLIQLINWVNNEKITCEQNVIAGASMGGLITRYALATMEQANQNHDTRLYISFDAPHQGVNITAGVQALTKILHDDFPFLPNAKEGLESLRRPATKQLLIHHIDEEYALREALISEIDQLGYPQLCRNTSIVSGSNQGNNGQQIVEPGDKLLDLNLTAIGVPGPFDWIPSYFELDIDMFSLERKDFVGDQKVLNADITLLSIWGFPGFPVAAFVNGDGDHYMEPSLYGALDSAPGGTRSTIQEAIAPKIAPLLKWFWLAAQLLPGYNIPFTNFEYEDKHSFTPSTSALDVDTDDLFFDIVDIENDVPNTLTPFDAYYSQIQNLQHVEVSLGVKDWMLAELPKSRVDLASVLDETYNYGRIINLIPEITITQTGILRINDNGPTGYLDGDNTNQEFFHVYTHGACDADITIQDGGQFILGSEAASYQHGIVHVTDGSTITVEAGGTLEVRRRSDLILESGSHLELSGLLKATFGGKIFIKDGASLRVTNGGTLRMIHSSRVIVEEGGQLIIEDGANINLWDNSNHRARIEVAGELVINGQLNPLAVRMKHLVTDVLRDKYVYIIHQMISG